MLILLVGKSGTGKSYLASEVCKKGKYKEVKSRTTRKERYKGEDTHKFVTLVDAEKEKESALAYTFYNGNHYYILKEDIIEKDIYIIDTKGIEYFKNRAEMFYIVVEVRANVFVRFIRMLRRGNSVKEAIERILLDAKEFKKIRADLVINNSKNNESAIKDLYRVLENTN